MQSDHPDFQAKYSLTYCPHCHTSYETPHCPVCNQQSATLPMTPPPPTQETLDFFKGLSALIPSESPSQPYSAAQQASQSRSCDMEHNDVGTVKALLGVVENKETFETGAQRDVQEGKLRFSLIPWQAMFRMATLYRDGADHYGDDNWKKGMPFSRILDSMERHYYQFKSGCRQEDHLASLVFGAFALMYYEDKLGTYELPSTLDDLDGHESRSYE